MKRKYRCPACGTNYPSQSMADHCLKSALCRKYNMPGSERKHAYVSQIQVTCCLEFFILPLSQTNLGSTELNEKVNNILLDINKIFPYLNELTINPTLYLPELNKTITFIEKLYPKNISINCLKLFEYSVSLIDELLRDLSAFWEQNPSLTAKERWLRIKEDIQKSIESFVQLEPPSKDDDEEADALFDDRFDDLLEFLWPRKIEQTKRQNLFLVNDRIWVVAYTRKDVREIVKKEFGLVDVKMCGIPHGEVMENGMSEREMINLAQGSCMVIGRTE